MLLTGRGHGTGFRSGLVHPTIEAAATIGESYQDIRYLARTPIASLKSAIDEGIMWRPRNTVDMYRAARSDDKGFAIFVSATLRNSCTT